MATISDLPIADFASLTDEQLQEMILEVRARRRNPDPKVREASVKKAIAKKKKGKAIALLDTSKLTSGLSKEQAQELLKQLKGGK